MIVPRLVVALLLFASIAATAAPVLTTDPPSVNATAGQTFSIKLRGTGFSSTTGGATINAVSGGNSISLQFNPAVLEIQSIAVDPRWNFPGGTSAGTVNNTAGTVTGLAFAAFPATTDSSFDIATITVRARTSGTANIAPIAGTVVGVVNSVPATVIGTGFSGTSVVASPAPPSAVKVPLPGWALLLLAGLIGRRLIAR